MINNVEFIQVKEFGIEVYNCKVEVIKTNKYLEYSHKEPSIYFIFSIYTEETNCHLKINEFHVEPKGKNIGKAVFVYMLEEIIKVCNKNKVEYFTIGGMLSMADYNNGYWPNSLIAYQKFADRFDLDFYITDMKTEAAYINCSENLKKDKYKNISDFYNPQKGKINSGYIHYRGRITPVSNALEVYYKYIKEKINEIEDEKKREYAEHQRLIQKGLNNYNEHLSIIDKIKKILNI